MANFFKRLFGNDEPAKKESVKEEGRYYFYDDRCSFKLDSKIIKNEVEKGTKFILTTEKMKVVIWILSEMPIHSRYPWVVGTEEMKVGGYPCVAVYSKTYSGIHPSYFIDCGDFVVQVNLPNNNTKQEQEFLNSFRKEGAVPGKHNTSCVDYVKELETVIYDYCEKSIFHSKPTFPIHKNINFKRNLNFDGLDMAEISMAFEKKFPVRIPHDHPYNQRLADDTDFTVGYFLSAYGLIDYESPMMTGLKNGVKYVWIIGFYDWDWNKPNPWGNPTYGFKPNPNSRIEKDKKPEIGDSFESKGESLYVEKCEFHQKLVDGTEEYYVVPTNKKP